MFKKLLTKIWVLPEKPKSPAVSGTQKQTPSSVKEQTASKTVRALEQKGLPEKTPKNKVQILGRKIYSDKSTIFSPVYDGQAVSVRFPIPSVDEWVSVMWLRSDKPEYKIRNESSYQEGVRIILAHILGKEFHLDWEPTLEDIVRWDFNQLVKSKISTSKRVIFVLDKNGGYMEVIVDAAQFLAKKIYDEREEKHSLAHNKQIVSTHFSIPSINDWALIWFQSPTDYMEKVLTIISDMFQKEFHVHLIFSKKDVLDRCFEQEVPSMGWLPTRKIIFDFKDNGGFIEIIWQESVSWSIGNIDILNVKNGQYYKKDTELLSTKKPTDWRDGVDVHWERIHQDYMKYGEGIDFKQNDVVRRVIFVSKIDWYVEMVMGKNIHGIEVVKYIAVNNTLEIWDIKCDIWGIERERNINLKVDEKFKKWGKVSIREEDPNGSIESGTYVNVTWNIECRSINCAKEVISTRWWIFVLTEINGTTVRWQFVSLKNNSNANTWINWNATIFTNAIELSNLSLKSKVIINIWEDLFKKKIEIIGRLTTLAATEKRQEGEFKAILEKIFFEAGEILAWKVKKKAMLDQVRSEIEPYLNNFNIKEIKRTL